MGKLVFISIVIAALSALIGERFVNLRRITLASRELVQNHLPNCVTLKNLDYGSEDITILGNGLAFISTGLKYPGFPPSDATSKIFALDMKNPRMKPVELRMSRSFDLDSFNAHGISVYSDPSDGTVYLFVVNHPHHKSQVEQFKAVPWSNVVYYSPEEVKVVSEGYYSANGINISPDKGHIYVADVFDHNVHVLERKEDNALVSVKSVAVGSLCDNIEVDPETGDLWLGCHPNAWKLVVFDVKDPPGSEVIHIQNIHSDQPVVTQAYADNGEVIIGSSVAATYGGKLLIGTMFHKAICCDLK